MTTTQSPILDFATPTGPVLGNSNFVVVRCDMHGTKETADWESFKTYVEVARDCSDHCEELEHQEWHYIENHYCFVDGPCCVVDPYGMLDY